MSRRYPAFSEADLQRLTGQKLTPQPQETRPGARQRKFRNIPTVVAGLQFDSKREAERAQELILTEKVGLITDLVLDKRQLRYPLIVNGKKRPFPTLSEYLAILVSLGYRKGAP